MFGKKRGRNGKKPGPPVHDDLVMRNFTADAPNELWLADITAHWTREGKLYLYAIKDVYSNRIVGYSIDSRMKSRIAVAALDNAVARRNAKGVDVAGCVLHTDRGSQFRSRKLVHQPNRYDMVGSMGRVGAAGDNAAMESFFSLLQKNVLDRRAWSTREELRIAIVTWIERAYHRRPRQVALTRLPPVEYKLIMKPAATQAVQPRPSPLDSRPPDCWTNCAEGRHISMANRCAAEDRGLAATLSPPPRDGAGGVFGRCFGVEKRTHIRPSPHVDGG